jgi:hypothetical protein
MKPHAFQIAANPDLKHAVVWWIEYLIKSTNYYFNRAHVEKLLFALERKRLIYSILLP